MKIIECDKLTWDDFADKSPQGTVFCKSYFLESYKKNVKYLQCLKGEEVFGGFAFVETSRSIVPMPYHVYCGIIFKDISYLKPYRQNEVRFSVSSSFAEHLFNNYNEIFFINHWDIIDLRPFEWFNYHEKEKGFYQIDVRYTSLLDISSARDVFNYSDSRKQCLKKSADMHFLTKESSDIELLDKLHSLVFEKQGVAVGKEDRGYLLNICENLIKAGSGRLFVTSLDGEPASASFFVYDKFRAYYLFGATDPRFKMFESGTRNLFDVFCFLSEKLNYKEIDFVGVNSPQRGFFKMSFGGRIVPYYQVTKAR
jgi:hypothetical protein